MKKQANKTTLQILFSLFAALILVACGGGGGSGSGAPPQKITFSTQNPSSGALTEDSVIHASLSEAAGFEASLNGVDISSLFVNDGDGSDNKKVNVYALQGILAETGKGTLTAKVNGSREEKLQITYHGKPELVFTNVAGGTDSGFSKDESLKTYTNIKGEIVEHTDIVVAGWDVNENAIPGEGEYITNIDGLVRNALAKSIGNGFELFNDGKKFRVEENSVLHSEKAQTAADYTLEVTSTNGVVNAINVAIPGKNISDIFAIKLNDIKKEHVIGAWVDEALRAYMREIGQSIDPIEFDVPADRCSQLFAATAQDQEDITGIPQDKLGTNLYSCNIKVTGISVEKAEAKAFDTSIKFSELMDEELDEGWRVEAKVEAIQPLIVTMKLSTKYQGDNGELEGNPTDLTVEIEGPSIGLTVAIGKVGEKYFALDIHSEHGPETYSNGGRKKNTTESLTISYKKINSAKSAFQNCEGNTCIRYFQDFLNIDIKTEIDEALGLFAGDKAYCWQPYTINSDSFNDYVLCNYESNEVKKPWEELKKLPDTPIFVDAEAMPKEIVSVIEQELTGSRFSAEGKGKSVPGFVSISGTHKARNDGVHINALGTHFAPEVATGMVKKAELSANADAVVALSSNSINQGLLSAYQSKQLQLELEPTLDSLGLSTFESDGYKVEFDKNRTVKVNLDFKAAPYVRFIDGYIEVVMRNLELSMDLETDATCSLGGLSAACNVKTVPNKTVVDIKARAKPNLNGGSLLQFSADDIMLDLSTNGITVSVTVFEQDKRITLNKKQLQSQIYPEIKSMLEDKLAWKVREKPLPICYQKDGSSFQALLDSFIPTSTHKTLQLQAKSFVFDTQEGESAHILLGANIVDGDKKQDSGLGIIKLVLNNTGKCNT